MARVKTYDPKNVKVIFGGNEITGFAPGTMITVTGDGDKFERVKGAQGDYNRINKNANGYSIALNLDKTSLSNDILSAALILDVNGNAGILPFTFIDLNGTDSFFALDAWLAKDPDSEHGDTMPTREWRIDTGVADKFDGGNNSQPL